MTSPYRIGVTGHRTLGDQVTVQFVTQAFHDLLLQAQREHPEGVIALSGLAEGVTHSSQRLHWPSVSPWKLSLPMRGSRRTFHLVQRASVINTSWSSVK